MNNDEPIENAELSMPASSPASAGEDASSHAHLSHLASLHTHNQLRIALALVVIIPALFFARYLITAYAEGVMGWNAALLIAVVLLLFISLGFFVIARHAINVTHLLHALENLLEGEADSVERVQGLSDVPAIEQSLTVLRTRMIDRIECERVERTIKESKEALECDLRDRSDLLENTNAQLQSEIEERRRDENLKDDFVSTVSHELRTPLAITKEGVSLLIDEIPGAMNEKQHKILRTISDNMDRLTRIINDLLDMSKIEAGKMVMEKAKLDMAQLAREAISDMLALAEKKGLTITGEFPADLQFVHADKDRVLQVLTNLIGNAMKFTEQGGLTISASNVGDMVVCRVEDTGVGLTPEEADSVFEKFVQVGRTHGAGIKGTGLGLAISRQIVGLHHGEIWVESEKSKGAAFVFSLPIYNEGAVVRETIEGVIGEAREAQEGFILLLFEMVRGASDEESFAAGYQRLLEAQTHVRSSDLAIPIEGCKIVLLANVRPDQIGMLYRRWETQVAACFMDAGALDVGLRCGYAEYPNDGSTPAELLANAEKTLSDMGALKVGNT
ncbi:MAG: signal transduction histidine kinase [Candidatus Promineifilaceae bacterium]|jgi:signal transduction histidine kinase